MGQPAGTWFWVDLTNDIVFIAMIQRMVGPGIPNLQHLSRVLVQQALVDPKLRTREAADPLLAVDELVLE